ncbi:P-loop containing nucleoside triphosphate hydrolase protein [Crepidotus variabilis]|uniref:P-loop containing nucleoside triphosphate hydrolase protein n=1 Tax=Crepidotus variabilis TaxID=179855 RepID=A0A9P6JMK3_9AGAR|nr:P-loop containing nucleoside triphosphate hydrolase protein [Crepidotus variabilis]
MAKPQQSVSEEQKSNESKNEADTKFTLHESQVGIWKLVVGNNVATNLFTEAKAVKEAVPLFLVLVANIYAAAPYQFLMFTLCQLWYGIEDAIQMHISSTLLHKIELGLSTKTVDVNGLAWSLAARVCFSVLAAYTQWCSTSVIPGLESRIRSHLDIMIMETKLKMDIPTSQNANKEQPVSSDEAWCSVKRISSFSTEMFRVVSQLALMYKLSHTTGSPLFALLCITKPMVSSLSQTSLWRKRFVAYVNNEPYKRMKALEEFTDGSFQQDVVSYGLRDWVISQYRQAFYALGNVSVANLFEQCGQRQTPIADIATCLLGELPFVYCTIQTIVSPSRFSVASFAILQDAAERLRDSLEAISSGVEDLRSGLAILKRLDPSRYQNVIKDGAMPYPILEEKSEKQEQKGMQFEFRSVSFAYPGSDKKTNALDDVSLNINAGDLVVIVGANGSGKSTLIRILSRLYDPSSGEIFIDKRPAAAYQVTDLHRATAILSQDSLIYPLSLAENIGLGHPACFDNQAMIEEAARDGGASEFIGKLAKGFETTLRPFVECFHHNISDNKEHPLWKTYESIEQTVDISGGERQRVVAARTFMRFKSGLVHFVAVDEPSSALDADGELHLFKGLLAQREGKTMVFVTHRFGHLTKLADQIICMKDGSIVEAGRHDELMSLNGEYANLYNIQATPFKESRDEISRSSTPL